MMTTSVLFYKEPEIRSAQTRWGRSVA